MPALAVAALAALESLLSATVADSMSVSERHDSDRELFGQGVANLRNARSSVAYRRQRRSPVRPSTSAPARGRGWLPSRSRLSCCSSSPRSRWVADIPLAALAGVLIATAVRMVEVSSLRAIVRATQGDAARADRDGAGHDGLRPGDGSHPRPRRGSIYALRQVARSVRIDEIPSTGGPRRRRSRRLIDEHIVAYRLEGALFFGAAHAFLLDSPRSGTSASWSCGCPASPRSTPPVRQCSPTRSSAWRAEASPSCCPGSVPEHAGVLDRLGVYDQLAHERHLFDTTPEAIAHARVHAGRIAHEAASTEALPRTIRP